MKLFDMEIYLIRLNGLLFLIRNTMTIQGKLILKSSTERCEVFLNALSAGDFSYSGMASKACQLAIFLNFQADIKTALCIDQRQDHPVRLRCAQSRRRDELPARPVTRTTRRAGARPKPIEMFRVGRAPARRMRATQDLPSADCTRGAPHFGLRCWTGDADSRQRLPQRFHQQMTRRKSGNALRRRLVATLWWVGFESKDCLEPGRFWSGFNTTLPCGPPDQ